MYKSLHSITILTTLKMYTSDYHTAGTAQDSSLSEQETVFQDRTGTRIHYCTLLQYLQHLKCTHQTITLLVPPKTPPFLSRKLSFKTEQVHVYITALYYNTYST